MSAWETFCDVCYYDLWRVRRTNERGFNDGFHLQHGKEAEELVELLNKLERERDEARAVLTTIHRWIERNHPDGFIDSLSYAQNLERVADRWHERLETVERERDKAIHGAHVNYNFTQDARRERDEAREALMKIEEIAVDGEDTYEHKKAMATIARAALEGAK